MEDLHVLKYLPLSIRNTDLLSVDDQPGSRDFRLLERVEEGW